MLIVAFFSWWYGKGWADVAHGIGPRLTGLTRAFSVGQLLRTLFAPWRRIITYPGASLADRWRAWGDNLFSRAIGFVVRLLVLLAAGLSLLVIAVLTLLEVIVWPLVPLAVPALVVAGFLV